MSIPIENNICEIFSIDSDTINRAKQQFDIYIDQAEKANLEAKNSIASLMPSLDRKVKETLDVIFSDKNNL